MFFFDLGFAFGHGLAVLLQHTLGEQMSHVMFLVPLVVECKLVASSDLLMTANLEHVEVREMSFGADMSQKVRGIAEVRSLGTDEAVEEVARHNDDL